MENLRTWPAHESKPDHWVSYVVVDQQWKFCLSRDFSYFELFDLEADPLEKKNLAEKETKVVINLRKKLDNWLKSLPEKPTGDVFSGLRNK